MLDFGGLGTLLGIHPVALTVCASGSVDCHLLTTAVVTQEGVDALDLGAHRGVLGVGHQGDARGGQERDGILKTTAGDQQFRASEHHACLGQGRLLTQCFARLIECDRLRPSARDGVQGGQFLASDLVTRLALQRLLVQGTGFGHMAIGLLLTRSRQQILDIHRSDCGRSGRLGGSQRCPGGQRQYGGTGPRQGLPSHPYGRRRP